MPIYKGENTFIERIYKGEIEMKRVYKGKDLVWGLYEVIFHDRDKQITSDYQPKRYVWGVDYEVMPEFDDEFDEYKTHFDGWYEDKTFLVAIPAITKDFHKDLNLYAKWRQRKYSYGGTVRYWTWDSSGGGGGGSVDPAISTSDANELRYKGPYSSYFWDNPYAYPGNYMANCTTYCYGRALKAGLPAPTRVNAGASSWGQPSNIGDGWKFHDYTDTSSIAAVVSPGDIIVGPGHVSFVENGGYCSASWYYSNGQDYGHRSTKQEASNWYLANSSYQFYHCVAINTEVGYPGGGGGHHNNITGYMTCSEGGGRWDDEPWGVSKTECGKLPGGGTASSGSQDYPDFPDPNQIKRGDTNPSGEYRSSFWDIPIQYTDVRSWNYQNNNWTTWTQESNSEWLIDWN